MNEEIWVWTKFKRTSAFLNKTKKTKMFWCFLNRCFHQKYCQFHFLLFPKLKIYLKCGIFEDISNIKKRKVLELF